MPEEKKETQIGKVAHYFPKINVGVIELTDTLKVGETIHLKGNTTDFEQVVESMQIEHKNVGEVKAGESVGLKVNEPAKEGDVVYRIEQD